MEWSRHCAGKKGIIFSSVSGDIIFLTRGFGYRKRQGEPFLLTLESLLVFSTPPAEILPPDFVKAGYSVILPTLLFYKTKPTFVPSNRKNVYRSFPPKIVENNSRTNNYL